MGRFGGPQWIRLGSEFFNPDDFDDFGTEPKSAAWAAVKGTFGGLKKGVKAITNATADMGAGLISLGQWDPDDVWAVDPMTDIGYDQSRFMASIGVNSLAGAAMGGPLAQGVGKLGQTLRFADQVDNVGQVVVGVQGAIDAVENDLNVTNGLQMVGGAAGGLGINPKPIGEATEATGKVLRGAAEGTVKAGVGAAGDVVRRAKEALAKSPEPEGKLLSPIELRMKLGDKLEELGVNLREQEFFVLGRSDKLLGDAATPFRHTGKGDLYMATEMDLLKLFGERSVLKAGGGNLDGILLTIDKQVFDKLLECQLVIKKEIDDMPGKVEYIFTADSAEILNAQGVWTRLGNEFFRGQ